MQLGRLPVVVVDEVSLGSDDLADAHGPGLLVLQAVIVQELAVLLVRDFNRTAGTGRVPPEELAVNHDLHDRAGDRLLRPARLLLNQNRRVFDKRYK